MVYFPAPFVLCVCVFCFFNVLCFCAFSVWGREAELLVWEYLDNSWRRAPAAALLDSAPVPQRAPVPAPARRVCAP